MSAKTSPESSLNAFERAAIEAICSGHPLGSPILAQIETALVHERRNTGSGFFMDFTVSRRSPPLQVASPIGDATADVSGLSGPVIFLLYLSDGYADCLECASVGEDDTRKIDFSSVKFTIPSKSGPIIRISS
ncbi:hypothetical protein [Mesorhizobium sp. KR9-304]|uniref:hypothetical protein n=1 Tax=Mesorhizobium sp. KR9-304 TaxID=3156614 RepID=UPI0032B47D3F